MSDVTARLALLAFIVIAVSYGDSSYMAQAVRITFLGLAAAAICVDISLAWPV